jgi:hypothetical protein
VADVMRSIEARSACLLLWCFGAFGCQPNSRPLIFIGLSGILAACSLGVENSESDEAKLARAGTAEMELRASLIRTKAGWADLARLKDRFCHTIVGWAMSSSCDEAWARRALRLRLRGESPDTDSFIIQFEVQPTWQPSTGKRLAELGICQCMSRKGECWDKLPGESLNGTIKREVRDDALPLDASQARAIVFDDIEKYCNTRRLHSVNGYVSPQERLAAFVEDRSALA